MKTFFLGLLFVVLGVFFIRYSRRCEENFGRIRRAELNLGGTHSMYVLVGGGLIVLGILFWFGVGGSDPMSVQNVNMSG